MQIVCTLYIQKHEKPMYKYAKDGVTISSILDTRRPCQIEMFQYSRWRDLFCPAKNGTYNQIGKRNKGYCQS